MLYIMLYTRLYIGHEKGGWFKIMPYSLPGSWVPQVFPGKGAGLGFSFSCLASGLRPADCFWYCGGLFLPIKCVKIVTWQIFIFLCLWKNAFRSTNSERMRHGKNKTFNNYRRSRVFACIMQSVYFDSFGEVRFARKKTCHSQQRSTVTCRRDGQTPLYVLNNV